MIATKGGLLKTGPGQIRSASRLRATPGQIARAWLLSRGPNVVVIPGTTSIDHLEENVGSRKMSAPVRLS